MAKYDIVSINYTSSGEKRGMINVDIQKHNIVDNSSYLLANEDMENNISSLSATTSQCLCFEISSNSFRKNENTGRIQNKTYIFDRSNSKTTSKDKNLLKPQDGNKTIHPLYDICDVCIKSPVQKSYSSNNRLPFTDRDVDIYAPTIYNDPIGFVHVDGRSMLLTEPLSSNCTILRSNLTNIPSQEYNGTYKMQYSSTSSDIALYRSPSQLCSDCSSYSQYVKKIESQHLSDEDYEKSIISIFEPINYNVHINNNYIIDLEQNEKQLKYDDGNVFGIAVKGKNYLNSLYEQDVTLTSSNNCRSYVGLIESNGRTYLKYVDNLKYTVNGPQTLQTNYQKIEEYRPTNQNQTANHKSNLFSIKIYGIPLDEEHISDIDDNDSREQMEQIKNDIRHTIFDIVKNVCPVNTQLFDVFFEGE